MIGEIDTIQICRTKDAHAMGEKGQGLDDQLLFCRDSGTVIPHLGPHKINVQDYKFGNTGGS